jgi:hypothetical protein
VRGFAETTHAAKSWKRQRRVVARIEATRLGLDIRYQRRHRHGRMGLCRFLLRKRPSREPDQAA